MASLTSSLGPDGRSVDAISCALLSLGHAEGHAGDTSSRFTYLDELYRLNITTSDGADIYGDTEELAERWLSASTEKRKDVFLGTERGLTSDGDLTRNMSARRLKPRFRSCLLGCLGSGMVLSCC